MNDSAKMRTLREEYKAHQEMILDIRKQLCIDFVHHEKDIERWEIKRKFEIGKKYPVCFPVEERIALKTAIQKEQDKDKAEAMFDEYTRRKNLSKQQHRERTHEEEMLEMEKRVQLLFNKECFKADCAKLMDEERALKIDFDNALKGCGYDGASHDTSAEC